MGRQVDVDPRAETDEAIALAAREGVARRDPAPDAARHEARHLHQGHDLAIRFDDHGIAFMTAGADIQVGVHELAGVVYHLAHHAVDAGAVGVGVEYAGEDADAQGFAVGVRITRLFDAHHAAIGRAQHRARLRRDDTGRLAQ